MAKGNQSMINEMLEFEAYITAPSSDTPRLQPKMLTDDFGNTGNLYGLEHILTIIARGFIFGNFFESDNLYDDGMISDDLIVCVGKIIFSWLGFECAKDYDADMDVINKWNAKYPQADGWFKNYYEKHCTKKDKAECLAKIEEKWSESLQGDDYRISVVSINNIVSNALELGTLKEQCMLVTKDSEVVKSQKLKDRFSYLFIVDEKAGGAKPQEKTVERFLKNIAAYLYLKDNHPDGQKFVLLDRIQLLCWYGLDDNKNEAGNWYLKRFLFDKGEGKAPIMTAISSARGWNFIKLTIDNDFIAKYDIKLIDVKDANSVDREKYWIIKDTGHGVGSLKCIN
jgi:hypothetical protein